MKDITVRMYDEDILINKKSGKGFQKVLDKIDPLISSMAVRYKINNYAVSDLKQELYLIAVQGIKAFDPNKNVKLSTFLHVHLNNKIISKLKSSLKKSNNAVYLNNQDEFFREINVDSISLINDMEESQDIYMIKNIYEMNLDFDLFLELLKEDIEYESWLIVKLLTVENLTIREISEKLNMNIWTVSNKLKKLSKNEYILSFYDREN